MKWKYWEDPAWLNECDRRSRLEKGNREKIFREWAHKHLPGIDTDAARSAFDAAINLYHEANKDWETISRELNLPITRDYDFELRARCESST